MGNVFNTLTSINFDNMNNRRQNLTIED